MQFLTVQKIFGLHTLGRKKGYMKFWGPNSDRLTSFLCASFKILKKLNLFPCQTSDILLSSWEQASFRRGWLTEDQDTVLA